MSSQEHILSVYIQIVPHLFSPCPVCTPSLQLMARQLSNAYSLSLPIIIFTIYVQRLYHLYGTIPERTPIFSLSLLPISIQYTLSTGHVQSEHHLSCPYAVSILSLLSMSSQYTTPSAITAQNPTSCAHVKSIHYLSCLYPVIMPPKVLCPCPVRIPSFLPLFQCTVSIHHLFCLSAQTIPHLYSPCPVCTPSLQPMLRPYPTVFCPCPVISIFTANVQRLCHLYTCSTTPDRTTECHLYSTSTAHV